MTPVRLAMGLLVGCIAASAAPARAQTVVKAPEVRRLNLDFKDTPFRKALEQVFAPGGLRVKLEADVPALPITLALKGVDEATAFRLLIRQAKKLEQDLQFEPIDDGYRIFLGKATAEAQNNPYPPALQPKLPKPFAPPTPDFPVVQNREVEPLINGLLQRVENGESLLPTPKGAEEGTGLAGGAERVTYGGTGIGNDDFGGNPFGGNAFGGDAFGGNDFNRDAFGGYGLGGNGYGQFANYGGTGSYDSFGGYDGFGGGLYGGDRLRQPRTVDPYSSPLAGGQMTSTPGSQSLDGRKNKRVPYFYDHHPQWIMEPRTRYWGNPRTARGGKRQDKSSNSGK